MELEIRDRPSQMWAEGTSDIRPTLDDIFDKIEERGFNAWEVKVWFDHMQGFWRFSADIRPSNQA